MPPLYRNPKDDRFLSGKPHHCTLCNRITKPRPYVSFGTEQPQILYWCSHCDAGVDILQPKDVPNQ